MEFKDEPYTGGIPSPNHINRIKVEFKDIIIDEKGIGNYILIESKWNLKM